MRNPYELHAGLRYTRAKRRNHFISFISLASMLGMVEIPENHSPVGPAVVVHSAARVLQNFGFGGALLRQLLKHLTGPLTSALQQSYRELESQFASDPGLHAPRNRAVGPTSSQQGQSSNEGGPGGVSRFGPSTLRGTPGVAAMPTEADPLPTSP